jgi:hypothetical protein
MARITPKTNWVANDIPVAPDFNRIENNNGQAFTELDQEVSDRQAAITAEQNARQAAITAEQNARIAADNTLQNNINIVEGKILKSRTMAISLPSLTGSLQYTITFTGIGFNPNAFLDLKIRPSGSTSFSQSINIVSFSFGSDSCSITFSGPGTSIVLVEAMATFFGI